MRGSCRKVVLFLLLILIPMTVALTIPATPPTLALAPVEDTNAVVAGINGQVNICTPPNPCVTAKLQVNASGPDTEDLAGTMLIYRVAPYPAQPCIANVTGSVTLPGELPTATLTGTLNSSESTNTTCVGGLQGLSVTLSIDSASGLMRLTTISATGVTEFLAVGTGMLIVTQTEQT
jgi:hypothetical protein